MSDEDVVRGLLGRDLDDAEFAGFPLDLPGPQAIRFTDGAVLEIKGECCADAWFGRPSDRYPGGEIVSVAVAGWQELVAGAGPQKVTEESTLILGREGVDPILIPLYCSHNGYYGACLRWHDAPRSNP